MSPKQLLHPHHHTQQLTASCRMLNSALGLDLLGCSFKTAPKVSQNHAWAEALLTASGSTLGSFPALISCLSPQAEFP